MKWHVGDRAVILRSCYPNRVGQVVTVMSELYRARYHRQHGAGALVHAADLPPMTDVPATYASYSPEHLGPINYDGNQASTWEAVDKCCGWQPKELVM